MIDLAFRNNTTDCRWTKDFFEKILDKAGKEENLHLGTDKKHGVSINLIGEGKIKALNKKYRGKNKVTDVLSFPLTDLRTGQSLTNRDIIDLGDIFICLPFAKKMAKRENSNAKDKLAFLTIHGFLHLLGFDHEKSKAEEKKMFNVQKIIFNSLNF